MFNINSERNRLARCGGELIRHHTQISADKRKEISRLGVRIVPDGIVALRINLAGLHQIAVAQKDRRFLAVSDNARCVNAQHIGAIKEIGDATETFCLALRAIGRA